MVLDFLFEHGTDILLAVTFVLCNIFNRPKDAEKILAKTKEKRAKKVAVLEKKAKKTMSQLQDLANEEIKGG